MAQLPKPFKRPSVSLSLHNRTWRDVPVYSLREGDIVRGRGAVSQVSDSPGGVTVFWKNGTSTQYSEGEAVHAFVGL